MHLRYSWYLCVIFYILASCVGNFYKDCTVFRHNDYSSVRLITRYNYQKKKL
jgi:hypothetical protein